MNIAGLIYSLFKPAAPAGSVNLPVQVDVNGPNTCVSISAPLATSSAPGLAQADGTTITAAGGVLSVVAPSIKSAIGLVIDGAGSVPATGAKGFIQVPFAGTITGWTLLADVSGSAQITVSKGTYAAYPTVVSIVALAAPGTVTPTPSTTGGTLAAGSYFWKVTALDAAGETTGSAEATATTTGSTGSVALAWAAVPGATSYKIYRGTTAGSENVYFTSATNSFTDIGGAGTAGTVPTTNTSATPPNLTTAQKNTSTTLTGWTTAVAAGDVLWFNLDSIATCTRLTLELQITRS